MSRYKQTAGDFEHGLVAILSTFVALLVLACPGLFLMWLLPRMVGTPCAIILAGYAWFRMARFGDDVLGTGFTR